MFNIKFLRKLYIFPSRKCFVFPNAPRKFINLSPPPKTYGQIPLCNAALLLFVFFGLSAFWFVRKRMYGIFHDAPSFFFTVYFMGSFFGGQI